MRWKSKEQENVLEWVSPIHMNGIKRTLNTTVDLAWREGSRSGCFSRAKVADTKPF